MRWQVLAVCMAAIYVGGCSKSASYQSLFAERLKAEQDLFAILKDVKDQSSMEKATAELRKISWRLDRIKKAFEALPELPDADKEEIERKFLAPLQAVKEKYLREAQRINALPGGEEFLKRMKYF